MAKLCRDAWRGNTLAAYVLEKHYAVPVKDLIHQTDPELSEIAGLISQYFHFVHEDNLSRFGLTITDTSTGFFIEGETKSLYQAFLEVSRKHNLKMFFTSVHSLANLIIREIDALEMLNWRRTWIKTRHAHRTYHYTHTLPT
jgi:hypothetical protein